MNGQMEENDGNILCYHWEAMTDDRHTFENVYEGLWVYVSKLWDTSQMPWLVSDSSCCFWTSDLLPKNLGMTRLALDLNDMIWQGILFIIGHLNYTNEDEDVVHSIKTGMKSMDIEVHDEQRR